MTFTVALSERRLSERWHPIALVSAHALARWFERSGKRDHSVLVRELAVLADASGGVFKTPP
jgi:hypothetical protein